MSTFGNLHGQLAALSAAVLGAISLNTQAATATFNPADNTVDLPVVEVLEGNTSSFFSARLQLVNGNELVLIDAQPIPASKGIQRNVFDSATSAVHVASVVAGPDEYYAKLRLVPGSNPLRFTLEQLVNNQFHGCPSFAAPGPSAGTCVLSGEITGNVTLTKEIQWILSGAVYVGGTYSQNGTVSNPSTITINPGTLIVGQQGADYLWIRPGSKIFAEGTPDNPIVFTGPLQQSGGEWGGLTVAGRARVNGCSEGVQLCIVSNEAVTSEFFGGNDNADNSGVLKYVQILFAGFQVRPDEELNGLTMNGVGSGTLVDYIHVHSGLDDAVEMFGGTVNMKHLVLTRNDDDNIDWDLGWQGKAQFVLIKQYPDLIGDHGFESDNNRVNNNSLPRSNPTIANVTAIGPGADLSQSSGAYLRRGTAGHIWNSVFTGYRTCVTLDGVATLEQAQSDQLIMRNTFVHGCADNFSTRVPEGQTPPILTLTWFNSQIGNSTADPQLVGYLPAAGSPLLTGGAALNDPFFTPVSYAGAFRDANDDWTQEWTFPF